MNGAPTLSVSTNAAQGLTLTLPAPRGRYATGELTFRLVDDNRPDPWDWNVSLIEDLASRGFVVITIDHTGEAPAVQFPDGHVVDNGPLLAAFDQAYQDGTTLTFFTKLMNARMADTDLVLGRLTSPPRRLTNGMDTNRIGMFGHSAGGFTAANMMYVDPRIKAGINMDGTLEYTVQPDGTNPERGRAARAGPALPADGQQLGNQRQRHPPRAVMGRVLAAPTQLEG